MRNFKISQNFQNDGIYISENCNLLNLNFHFLDECKVKTLEQYSSYTNDGHSGGHTAGMVVVATSNISGGGNVKIAFEV